MPKSAEVSSTKSAPRATAAAPRSIAFEGRELDHRMANSLQLATDFLLFEQFRVVDPIARAALTAAAARLSSVGQMHRFLSAHGETTAVAFKPFVEHLAGYISGSTGLSCTVDADLLTLKGETAQQIAIVINELAMNASKHAYAAGELGAFHIAAHNHGHVLRISVSDKGRGLDAAFSTGFTMGLGMTIVQAIVRQLKATLHAENDHGAKFTFSVSIPSKHFDRSFAPRGSPF